MQRDRSCLVENSVPFDIRKFPKFKLTFSVEWNAPSISAGKCSIKSQPCFVKFKGIPRRGKQSHPIKCFASHRLLSRKSRSVGGSVTRSVGRSVSLSVVRPVVRSVVRTFGQSFGRLVCCSVGRSFFFFTFFFFIPCPTKMCDSGPANSWRANCGGASQVHNKFYKTSYLIKSKTCITNRKRCRLQLK